MARLKLEFEGFEEVFARLKMLGGEVKATAEKALGASRDYVNANLHKAMVPHKRTGDTEKAIVENTKVEWAGTIGILDVGFDLERGGMPSIFLMYGTPKMDKDQKLYNAVYGNGTKKKVHQIQEDTFYEEIRRLR